MLALLTDKLVLQPTRHEIAADGKARRWIEGPGVRFEVWTEWSGPCTRRHADVFVLKFPGIGGRAERATVHPADVWDDLCAEVWAVNPPGYGGSPGRASLKVLPQTAEAVLAAIRREADGRPVVVTGNSLGSATALHVAASGGVAALILRNPPPLRELILGRFGWWNLNLAAGPIARQIPPELCSIGNAGECRVPAVFISSSRDRIVPASYQQRVFDAYAGPTQIVRLAEADHACPMQEHEMGEYIGRLRWLRERLGLDTKPAAAETARSRLAPTNSLKSV